MRVEGAKAALNAPQFPRGQKCRMEWGTNPCRRGGQKRHAGSGHDQFAGTSTLIGDGTAHFGGNWWHRTVPGGDSLLLP
jgi:hypothetical protein